jgi:hypothetical protein
MELEIFSLADFAADYGNGKLTVVGTFDTIFTPNLPVVHPHCSVAVRIRVANSEAGHHDFEIKVIDPDGKVFQNVKGGMDINVNPIADYNTMNLVMNLNNLTIQKAGKFAFEFHFDNEFRSGLKLNVVQAMPPGMVKAA